MNTLERVARYGVILGFLFVSTGCVIADGPYDGGYRGDRERGDRYRDERRCGEHDDEHCRDHHRDHEDHDR